MKINRKQLYTDAWKDYKKHWHTLLLIMLTAVLVNFMSGFGEASTLAFLVSWLAGTWITIGSINFLLNVVDGKEAQYKDIFYGVKSIEQFAYFVIVGLVYGMIVLIGTVLLIIPGIILGLGLFYASYYIAENRLGLRNALSSSWEITKGHKWAMFKLFFFLLILNLLGFMLFGLGLILTIPFTHLIYARLYRQLEGIPLPDAGEQGVSDDEEEKVVYHEEITITETTTEEKEEK